MILDDASRFTATIRQRVSGPAGSPASAGVVLPTRRQIWTISLRRVSLLVAALVALQLALQLLPGQDNRLQGARLLMLPVASLLAAASLFCAARRSALYSRRLGIAWTILAAAQTAVGLGDVMVLGSKLGVYHVVLPTLPDGLYVLYYLFVLTAIWHFPKSLYGQDDRFKLAIDLGMMLLGLALLGWTFFAGPLLTAAADYHWIPLALAIAYPAADLFLLLSFITLLLRPAECQRAAPIVVLALGTFVLMLTHSFYVEQFLLAGDARGGFVGLGSVVGCLLVGLAGALQAVLAPAPPPPADRRPATWPLYVPYVWLAAAMVLLIWSRDHAMPIGFPGLVVGASSIIALMLVRQVVAVREDKYLHEQLRRGRDELEMRVAERTAALAQTNQDLQAEMHSNAQLFVSLQKTNQQLLGAMQAKDEMLQNVSHELRTPLMLILGYVELLHADELGTLEPEQAEAVEIILRQGERLRFMVNRLLTLQTFDPNKMKPAPLDVSQWIEQSVEAWQVRAGQAGISLVAEATPPLPQVIGDRDFLGQVLENLLDNAVKFTPQNGQVRVRAWGQGNELIFGVLDDGVGIPPDKLRQVFERFYQVDGRSNRRFGGMGIGLALCRTIVDAHHGRIWAESRGENLGSAFYVALLQAPSSN
jgi:signal transduction histidine kinase